MQFHFEKTLEKRYEPQVTVTNETPAWLMICLAESIKDWIGQSPRIFCKSEEPYLQFGYEVLTFPVAEFAQIFGPLIYAINQAWPVQVFGMGSQDELVELSFTKEGTAPTIQQKNVSGIPCAELRDLYFCVKFPDPLAADCMFRLLDAVEKKSAAVALEWEYADFLEQQRLARIDRTLSYCYVSLEEEESADPVGWLSGLTLQQKCELWRMFLGKRLFLPEFEWLRDAMLQGAVPNWIEWHLALYRVLEEENIRFFCKDGQFELLDKEGHRIYFGVDHSEAAEQVLMKVLFPLNQCPRDSEIRLKGGPVHPVRLSASYDSLIRETLSFSRFKLKSSMIRSKEGMIMMTWKTRLLHFERMCDGLVEHFLLQHKILGFLLIFIGMPLVTLSAVCICSTVLVLPLALAFGYL